MNIKKATKPRNYAFFQSREEVETLVVSLERKSAKKKRKFETSCVIGFLDRLWLIGLCFSAIKSGKVG